MKIAFSSKALLEKKALISQEMTQKMILITFCSRTLMNMSEMTTPQGIMNQNKINDSGQASCDTSIVIPEEIVNKIEHRSSRKLKRPGNSCKSFPILKRVTQGAPPGKIKLSDQFDSSTNNLRDSSAFSYQETKFITNINSKTKQQCKKKKKRHRRKKDSYLFNGKQDVNPSHHSSYLQYVKDRFRSSKDLKKPQVSGVKSAQSFQTNSRRNYSSKFCENIVKSMSARGGVLANFGEKNCKENYKSPLPKDMKRYQENAPYRTPLFSINRNRPPCPYETGESSRRFKKKLDLWAKNSNYEMDISNRSNRSRFKILKSSMSYKGSKSPYSKYEKVCRVQYEIKKDKNIKSSRKYTNSGCCKKTKALSDSIRCYSSRNMKTHNKYFN
ncbi:unnamed protein product [Moneuplotes crassus]|uniref:Uncharacterized protein n=1 Tax=Euplotes crassus TaxID=5936 RepID=A0AAD1UMQ1_EUPCR|nr:unnamed protein product [Moneuplotes crassus]